MGLSCVVRGVAAASALASRGSLCRGPGEKMLCFLSIPAEGLAVGAVVPVEPERLLGMRGDPSTNADSFCADLSPPPPPPPSQPRRLYVRGLILGYKR